MIQTCFLYKFPLTGGGGQESDIHACTPAINLYPHPPHINPCDISFNPLESRPGTALLFRDLRRPWSRRSVGGSRQRGRIHLISVPVAISGGGKDRLPESHARTPRTTICVTQQEEPLQSRTFPISASAWSACNKDDCRN